MPFDGIPWTEPERSGSLAGPGQTDSAGTLTDVTDSYGRSFGFTFSSAGVITELTTPDALELSYGYIDFTSGRLLETVAYNTAPETGIAYLYEKTQHPYALTGITDENGGQYAFWDYDGAGRAISSALANDVNLVTVSYISSGEAAVSGPLGEFRGHNT